MKNPRITPTFKIEFSDVAISAGLVLLGVGLYLSINIGVALSVEGALLIIAGFLSGIKK